MTSSPPPRLSSDAQDALADFRDASPGPQRRRANLDAVRERVSQGAPAKAAAGLLWPLGWGLVSAAAAAGLVWGLVDVGSTERSTPQSQQESPAVVVESPAAPVASSQPQPRPVASDTPADPAPVPRTKRSTAGASVPRAAAVAFDLREETRRLRNVRAQMANEAWSDAARQLDAYTHAFPDGALREDAQAYRIIVQCEQGRSAEVLRRAFDDRYPASPHMGRMDAACVAGGKK
ncbi:MAG: hypothetical protein KUG77_12965 [Nannocystaceae bacterium]|nr:hypothetical protein [Nannocystaceae bacterium]